MKLSDLVPRSVERELGGGAEASQAYESCRDGTGWKSRASPEGEPLGGWEGEVEEHLWVGVGGSRGALGSGDEKCGEGTGWRSRAKAELGTTWRGLSSNEALGLGHEKCGEGIGWRSRAKSEV